MYHINDLISFTKVVETGGMASASEQLAVAVATLSHRIAKLEHALGVSLFFRTNKGMTLSPEGQMVYEKIVPILDAMQDMHDSVGNHPSEVKGKLRVTLPSWILNQYVLPTLSQFKTRHPALQLELIVTDAQRDISYEGIDVAIRVGTLPDSRLLARKLADDRRVLCASPSYLKIQPAPSQVSELRTHHRICLPWLRHWTLINATGERTTLQNNDATLVTNADSLSQAMLQGMGIGMRSYLAVAPLLKAGTLVEVLPASLVNAEAPVWFVRPNSRLPSEKVEQFYRFCQAAFASPSGE